MNRDRWTEVESLYHAALEREPAQRGAFLEQCPDAELRSEVQSLLDHEQKGEELLENPRCKPTLATCGQSRPSLAGTRLGAYEIIECIGVGGMGEVYRARDARLGRNIALKVLPEEFVHDVDRMRRFEREARLLASLNHPNIAAVYGLEELDGVYALAMELVEGPTLQDRIGGRAMGREEALTIAKQIAEALEYAHERGIIHRDLKPANVKLTIDGKVKLLDFGLAKALDGPTPSSATLVATTAHRTDIGVILGTPAFMAPEQAQGKPVDRRADIWSFGVVLWEMLTGKELFSGETAAHVLANVIGAEMDFKKLPKTTPAVICELLKRCLDRNANLRLRDIGEARIALHQYLANPENGPAHEGRNNAFRSPRWWKVAASVLASVAAIFILIYFQAKGPVAPVLRFTLAVPENSAVHSFAISPDARHIVIAAAVGGRRQLWLRALDAIQAQPMPFTEDATYPFWSPDSRFIAFFAQNKLKKIAVNGGPAESICDVLDSRGGSWGRDNMIAISPHGPIQRVSASGGVPVQVMNTKDDQRHPVFLPDGRRFLYMMRGATPEKNGIYIASLDGSENRRILADVSGAVFAPPPKGSNASGKLAHILFIRANTLVAQAFDPKIARLAGDVLPIAEGVSITSNASYAPVTASDNGVLLYATGSGQGGARQFAWRDRSGTLTTLIGSAGPVFSPALSPDGRKLVFMRNSSLGASSSADLWVRDLAHNTETRFTTDPSINNTPFWSRNGDRIVFASNRNGAYDLFQKASDGTGRDEPLLITRNSKIVCQWSRDGRFIVYCEYNSKKKSEIWVLPLKGAENERKPVPFLQTEFNEGLAQLSPDSRWMAFTSEQSGRPDVYVRPFPRAGRQWTISASGGQAPRWRGDGKELFFVAADGKLMAVPVKAAAAAFETGSPVALFDAHLVEEDFFMYDVTADGQHFLITTDGFGVSSPPLNVVVNWNSTLKH